MAPHLVKVNHGKQEARGEDLQAPLTTVTAAQRGHALVSAFLAKYFGGVVGQQLHLPAATITAKDHHGLAAATLVKFRGDERNGHPGCSSLEEPLSTVTAGGNHLAEVRAFLTTYYGSDGTAGKGQRVLEPMRTVTARHRLGLVTVEGTQYQIIDIGMRMLQPHELLRAQFGAFAEAYDLSAARTKADQVRLIGNSVCPEVAEAVVRANLPQGAAERDVA